MRPSLEASSTPLIGARASLGLVAFLEQRGVDPEPLLARVRLERAALDDPEQLLSLRRFVQLLELAAQASQDDCFGAHYAGCYPIEYTGLAGYATVSCARVGDGCRAIARYYALLADATELALTVHGERACLSYTLTDATIWPRRQDAECMVRVLFDWLRVALGRAWAPLEVWFEHARPSGARELERIFEAPLRFEQPRNALWFSRELLQRPLAQPHGELAQLLEPYLEQLLERKARATDLGQRVVDVVKGALGSHSLAKVARQQGMGARTLQRRLRASGVSYQEMLDRARHQSSLALLADRSLSIGQVADRLGYADVTTFNRAFRRWTGRAPSHYRRELAG
jgi:AraC-like DNA-binding protein